MIFANPFARIVVGYDDSDAADTALEHALVLAEQFGGDLVAVHAGDVPAAAAVPIHSGVPMRRDPAPTLRSLDPYRYGLFGKLSDRVAARPVPVALEFVLGGTAAGIIDAAARWDATAIVLGTHAPTGLAKTFAGSITDTVARMATLPVLVVRQGMRAVPLSRVVVGVDASDPSANASGFAVALTREQPVRLVYATVADTASIMNPIADVPFDPTPLLHELRASARDALDRAIQQADGGDVFADTEIAEASDPASGLAEVARRQCADAVIVGTHRRGAVERFFIGSTAEALLRRSDVPVIIVPVGAPMVPEAMVAQSAER